jgi:hypothetical protein
MFGSKNGFFVFFYARVFGKHTDRSIVYKQNTVALCHERTRASGSSCSSDGVHCGVSSACSSCKKCALRSTRVPSQFLCKTTRCFPFSDEYAVSRTYSFQYFSCRQRLDAPECIRFGDKLTYLLAVVDALFTAYVLVVYPFALPWVYTVKFPILIGIRVFDYAVRNSWGWFLIDFCYAANMLLLVYLWLFPNWTQLFNVAFAVLVCVMSLKFLYICDVNV